ncbi:MAG: adenylate/guanylate cyclase domain-containing protein [Deltaproteobacteria bacterium]|nr:adenylate/guanylate cyclase domain-containing protein [Deltaproteobacteria bacterium]
MNADAQYEIKNKNWFPCFKDAEIERDFMREFNLEALKSGKIGVVIILTVWVGFAWFDMHLIGHGKSSALFFRLAVATPLFFIVLAGLYSKYANVIYQIVVLLLLFIIQCSIYQVVKYYDFQVITESLGYELPLSGADGKYLFVFVWLLVIFMASMIARLNILQSILSGLSFIFVSLLSVFYYHPSVIIIIIIVPFLITTLPIVWIGSLHVQQYARENYRATKLLTKSKLESESLLLNILPVQIADRLKKTPGTIVDGFKHVTVLFADIVGFTKLSEQHRPESIVHMLNRLFSKFDTISKQYGAEKIKTIGDAYMLAAGIPEATTNHSAIAADCALDMIKETEKLSDPDGNSIQIRIGIHTGPAIAGVIGTHKFSYDLLGDTVNTASRMESHGDAGKIQVSEEIYKILQSEFIFEPRDEIKVKGKGLIKTFWLKGRRGALI